MDDPYKFESGITVGKLIEKLQRCPKDAYVCFGPHGAFSFNEIDDLRGGIVQIDFNEIIGVHWNMLPEHPGYNSRFR